MAFLKRLNVSSHSRSSSHSSVRTPLSANSNTKANSVKPLPDIPNVGSRDGLRRLEEDELGANFKLDGGTESQCGSAYSSDSTIFTGVGLRKPSTESGALHPGKMIYSWDTTDPDQWSMQRVIAWFKLHDFDEQWILFFKRNRIYGKKFLQLLAHDNFNKYESFLAATKNSSYIRFQHLLKRTLEENVSSGHRRQRSSKYYDSKSFDFPGKHWRRLSNQSDQRSGESKAGLRWLEASEDKGKNHQKTKSASMLYRRSFISLRSTSSSRGDSNDECRTLPAMKITIPPRPFSTVEGGSLSASTLKLQSSPLSPATGPIFRKEHKSSSSDSSVLHASNSRQEENRRTSSSSSPYYDEISPRKFCDFTASALKSSPRISEDRTKIWDKFKKMALSTTDQHYNSRMKQGPAHLQPVNSVSRLPGSFERKYYPVKKSDTAAHYVLLTKDNVSFIPLDVSNLRTLAELNTAFARTLGIKEVDFTVHLTDFGCGVGAPLPQAVFDKIRLNHLKNQVWKFCVRENQPQPAPISRAVMKEPPLPGVMESTKVSGRSAASSFTSSNEDINSYSDITSVDENGNLNGRRAYPQTPNHYYSQATASHSSEFDYWNIKERIPENPGPIVLSKLESFRGGVPASSSIDDFAKHSFKVIRKHSNNEIDFNKGRESPYVRPELAPKREAPKPPLTGSQISLASSSSIQSSLIETRPLVTSPAKLKRHRTGVYAKKLRPPPPKTVGSSITMDTKVTISLPETPTSDDVVVPSYTPATSQILIPRPYHGVATSSKDKTSENQPPTAISATAAATAAHTIFRRRTRRSMSAVSVHSAIHYARSSLNKRGSARRIVSSTSAADIFDENDISFADAPELSDYDSDSNSSDDIIWSDTTATKKEAEVPSSEIETPKKEKITQLENEKQLDESVMPTRKMTLRPTAEVVYQNLEMFFPDTDLDKPILEGGTPPASPESYSGHSYQMTPASGSTTPSSDSSIRQSTPRPLITKRTDSSHEILAPIESLKPSRRTKTIRTIAREASEACKNSMFKDIRRHNTKMWGTKVVEVTDKGMVSINKSKNSKGEYREFAWIKGEIIGKGSFGAVYLGLNVTTGEMMAVKQVEVPKYGSQDEVTVNTVEALISEVSTLKNLDHLNIVQYLGFESKNGIYSLFLEYVAGGSVGSLIRLYGHFDEQLIRFLTRQVLEGLAYLHLRGILHRDMKADNLLLDNDGVCKISDFGISRKSNNIYSNSEMTMRGTVFWMAPEMVDTTQGYSAKVDIWSLGCIVLEMFAGRRPWSNLEVVAAMFQIGKSKAAPPIPEDTLPLILADGRMFLDDCFRVDPEERPTADKLLSHPFCQVPSGFDFSETELSKFIKQNDKLNNSKLRINSRE